MKIRGLLEYVYADLWEYVFIVRLSSDFLVSTRCKAIFAVAVFVIHLLSFFKACVAF